MAAGQAGNDFAITFLRLQILSNERSVPDGQIAGLEPIAVIQMSPQTMKDLSLLVTHQIAVYEAEWGEIETEFTRRRAKAGA